MKRILIILFLIIVFYILGYMAGFSARDNKIKKETIVTQEKKINNTVEIKKEVCKANEVIKKYEINCSDVVNFDLSKCM